MPSPAFTQDWFSRSIPGWQFILFRMTQKTPHLRILEVGVFEGRSTCWLLENFCKTPESTIVALDTFQGGIEHKNMELGGLKKQFEEGSIKFCPWCYNAIERDPRGCKYMTCKSRECNSKKWFCFDCLKKLNRFHEKHPCCTPEVETRECLVF